jgi:aspartokinase/homoserine dehydrogenase 1
VEAWRVHKFGGSSVADASCMARVARILEAVTEARLAVVLSACKGVTDALLGLVRAAERQDPGWQQGLNDLQRRHAELACTLLDADAAGASLSVLAADCRDISGMLQTVQRIRAASPALRDAVAGFGELWSSRLFARYLQQRARRAGVIEWVDARDVVLVDWGQLGPNVRWPASRQQARPLAGRGPLATLIIPGFVARDANGVQTTLGRNGSDFSASIFADLLGAAEIVIWTDVEGVMSADPRLVPGATVIDSLSYHEAMELAYFGARVIHPQTMGPAVAREIPIWIRNTFAPERAGTLVCARPTSRHLVKGITSIDSVALVNLEGAGMIGVPGTAQRLFSALREHEISVVLISQGSSEHSICFAVPRSEAGRTEQVVREEFARELINGQIESVDRALDCSILAVVGDGMAGTHGVAAKVFGALGNAGVNVRAIAQGSSERNISLVIEASQTTRALRAVHASFYLSAHTISVGLLGCGAVGRAFIEQLASQRDRLQRDMNLDIRLRGICTSGRMLLEEPSLSLDRPCQSLPGGEPTDLERFEAHVHAEHLPHAVIVDCTASADVAKRYPAWLAKGIHVVTPNKKAGSADLALHAELQAARHRGGSHYLYEATVGAGLPVIQTIRDLRETGDDVALVEGILSGTLSYLFNVWDGQQPFSNAVREARSMGYTEPDPRDDLSGLDVARKLVILAREIGLGLTLEDVEVESLVPERLAEGTVEAFLEGLEEFDERMLDRLSSARARGRVLRYVGVLDAVGRRATVGLVELDSAHAFAHIDLTDNIVRFTTRRYHRTPLVVQGPGAGPEVTAGGVFADLLRVCAYLGARM